MARISVSLACGVYDRTVPLFDGSVQVEGVDLIYAPLEAGESFLRTCNHAEFDIAEMSISAYLMMLSRGDDRFIGIPVFPSRVFRHDGIFVNAQAGIENPADLNGRRIGVHRYHMTANLWIRGILSDEYQVDPSSVHWVKAGIGRAGVVPERVRFPRPDWLKLEVVTDRSLDEMLVAGDLDAVFWAAPFGPFVQRHPSVRRLFSDPEEVMRSYFQKTRIFPPMHMVVLKRGLAERHPWIAPSVLKAFEEAKRYNYRRTMTFAGIAYSSLPFYPLMLERMHNEFGQDPWPYGLKRNEHTLRTAIRYSVEQGLASREVAVEELFAANALEPYDPETVVAKSVSDADVLESADVVID